MVLSMGTRSRRGGFNGAAYASIIAEGAGLLILFVVIHAKPIE